ncbi:PaaI family thioesterase [candidate division FCPU426 bacterium]|nr:PaaI family thioesterase [candidate division FCPU426 bacterium]
MTTEIRQKNLEEIRARAHASCRLCGAGNPLGMKLKFQVCDDGSVQAIFFCRPEYMGYDDQLHGGVISSLLDSAMTNCMFSLGKPAVTAELKVRYHQPAKTDEKVVVRAWLEESFSRMHVLKAELFQHGEKKASARAKFMERRD